MTELKPDQFEMRRLESLSNTIFGVAMTLLAYDLPKAAVFASAPGWSDLAQAYSGKLAGFVLSFIIAGVFWISHQRRLARQPIGSRGVVILNLFFLLSIVLLPVTNGLYTNYGMSSAVAVLYGLNLTAIAGFNVGLWWTILGGWHREIMASLFPLLVFVPGTAVAAVAPRAAQFVWLIAFGGLLIQRFYAAPADKGP
ncbi:MULTISPECIES: TMEM175 family protein [unclassified Bradyrhizobium]|uniref:TMEM175 family protein n=1 Tax=unclassified Bradyrhizobium TaxID=2631580 RepID=UPI00247A0B8F|nr:MULTISPECIES: TMEM175 family protein [unclassified Bradyrhizobium]WGR74364.1 TMEM175 family protein [Bradyrhizobium sp. ISRA426]WGR79199.1 TMEM175 family protein [Bradyrhizobium sp. ISRA430]WGR89536.1 TMEM175 family protein [Bradyrhizobium sp. ISRA432]